MELYNYDNLPSAMVGSEKRVNNYWFWNYACIFSPALII